MPQHLACGISQLSETSFGSIGGHAVAINKEGTAGLILSRADWAGHNGDGNTELFRLDFETGEATQLTDTRLPGLFSEGLSASRDLNRIVFRSGSNPFPSPGGDYDEQEEVIFLHDFNLGISRRITGDDLEIESASDPLISGDGNRITFISEDDPLGLNPGEHKQVFLYDIPQETLSQITELTSTSSPLGVAFNYQGTLIALHVKHYSWEEIRLLNTESGQTWSGPTSNRIEDLFLSDSGERLLFTAYADLLPPMNPDGSLEVFLVNLTGEMGSFGVEQITHFEGEGDRPFQNLEVSPDGGFISFVSQANLSTWEGNGTDNLYLADVDSGLIHQVTYLSGSSYSTGGVMLSDDPGRILLSSTADYVGRNSDRNEEAFLVECGAAELDFFPQIGNGTVGGALNRSFRTQLVFANTGPDSSVLIEFFDQQGQPRPLNLTGYGAASVFHFLIQRGTPLVLETSGTGPLIVGYARIKTASSVTGTAVFTGSQASSGIVLHQAAVPLTKPLRDFSIVVDTSGNFETGLALVNTEELGLPFEEGDSEIELRLYDQSFNLLGFRELDLGAGEHTAFYVSQVFSEVKKAKEMVGMLTVSSPYPLAAITLRQMEHPTRQFPQVVPTMTTYPVAPQRPDEP